MAKAADTGGQGSPFAKFNDVGDTLVGAFGSSPSECRRQARNFDDGKPAVKGDGSPRWEELMYFIAMPGTTAKTGDTDNGFHPIAELDEVRFAVGGFKWGQVIEQRKQLPTRGGFKVGQACSGDVYTIKLVGWSAECKNVAAAEKAGFTVVDNRIILRSQDEKDKYVLAQSRTGGNTNPAKDYEITVRRPTDAEKAFEQAADALFDAKPWARQVVTAGAPAAVDEPDDEPF